MNDKYNELNAVVTSRAEGGCIHRMLFLRGSTQVYELVPCVDGLGSFFRVQGSNPTVDGFFNFTLSARAAR